MTADAARTLARAGSHRYGVQVSAEPRDFLLCCSPRRHCARIRRMNQTASLGRYLPAFRRIVGQMQHDLFHVYTVDQHILTSCATCAASDARVCARVSAVQPLIASLERIGCCTSRRSSTTSPKAAEAITRRLGRLEARRFCASHGLRLKRAARRVSRRAPSTMSRGAETGPVRSVGRAALRRCGWHRRRLSPLPLRSGHPRHESQGVNA